MEENESVYQDGNEPYAKRRMDTCRSCEKYRHFVCMECGCFMPVKTRLRAAECPLKKWLKET